MAIRINFFNGLKQYHRTDGPAYIDSVDYIEFWFDGHFFKCLNYDTNTI